jgi:hypothetical protein
LGIFCVTRSALPIIARSTITRCATNSAADHSSAFGFAFHCAAGTESATQKNAVCTQLNFSSGIEGPHAPTLSGTSNFAFSKRLESNLHRDPFVLRGPLRLSHRQPAQMHAPVAERALPQTLARRFGDPQAACHRCGRMAQRSREAPPVIP